MDPEDREDEDDEVNTLFNWLQPFELSVVLMAMNSVTDPLPEPEDLNPPVIPERTP